MSVSNEYLHARTMAATEERLRELMLCGLAGDTRAYEICLKELSAHLRAFFRKRLSGQPDQVEDLVQETLLALHNQRHTYAQDQPLTPWVYAIARYKMVDMLRHWKSHDALNDPLDDEHELFGFADTREADTHRDVARMLAQLPDRQRLPIEYVKLQGLTVVEAARETGLSESAVKIGVHRGLKALAALMKV